MEEEHVIKDGLMIQKDIPLPKIKHQVLGEDVIGTKQVFVVGDLHGCLEEFKELLEAAGVTRDNAVVICCGDIANKGPHNEESIRYVRDHGGIYTVRGNHEDAIIHTWHKMAAGKWHKEKRAWVRNLRPEDVDYLQELPYTISIPSLRAIIVHAGIRPPLHPLESQHPLHMVTMRNLSLGGDGEVLAVHEHTKEGVAWGSVWKGPEHIYFGHDARRNLQQHQFATGLDSRCVYGDRLTGVFLTGDRRMLHVKAKREWCVKNK